MNLQPTFPGMLPNERVVLLLHRHWVTAVQIVLAHAIFGAVPLVAWWALGRFTPVFQDPTTLLYPIAVLGLATYALVWALVFFISWLTYYLDTWIVTNERIINIKQVRLFDRVVSEQKLFRVQDVTSEVKGPLAGLFGFGNVTIQTAAEQGKFTFEHIPNPEGVAKAIMNLLEQIENQMGANTMAKLDGDVVEGAAQNPPGGPEPPAQA